MSNKNNIIIIKNGGKNKTMRPWGINRICKDRDNMNQKLM